MANERQRAASFAGKRANNTTNAVSILSGSGVLHTINVANGAAAVATLTVTIDGATAVVLAIPANDSRSFVFDAKVGVSLSVTPSAATLDAWVAAD